jgi:peptide/nickel transport system permease protein
MPAALARRFAVALATVVAVLTLTFLLLHLAPGDPVALYLGPGGDEAAARAMREQLGLDRPLALRYGEWLVRFVSGDWGNSIAQRRPVAAVLGSALGPTLLLTGVSLALTWLAGTVIGVAQAARERSRTDLLLTGLTTAVQAVPAYVLALALVLVFAYGAALWGWPPALRLPAMGAGSVAADFLGRGERWADQIRHLVLPVITLAVIGAGGAARFVRISTVGALRQPFVLAARARGLGEARVLFGHALRSALVPLVTIIGLQLPALFSGVVFVETIFAWPGMGRVMVLAVLARDYPVVMAATAVFAVLVVAGNLLADLLVAAVDPRARDAA